MMRRFKNDLKNLEVIMKKFVVMLLCAVLTLGLFACSKDSEPGTGGSGSNDKAGTMKLSDMINAITEGIELPSSDVFDLDKSTFKEYSFVDFVDGIEAICSESMVSSIAHSMVLIRTNGEDAEKLAQGISENADVRKWICAEAQVGKVLYNDDYVFMVMTFRDSLDGIKANFEKIVGADGVKVLDIKSSGAEE